jgi:hypothetical protein
LGRLEVGPETRNHDRKVLPGKIGRRKNFTSDNDTSKGDKNSLEENFTAEKMKSKSGEETRVARTGAQAGTVLRRCNQSADARLTLC